MNNKMILNVVHRPEMVPEYAEKLANLNQKEDVGKQSVLTESLDIFRLQQDIAHKNGIRVTIQMTYASLFHDEAVQLAKQHHAAFGDEIGLTLLGLTCEQFRQKYQTKDFCIWMFSWEDKKAIVDDVFGKFYEVFGFYPASTGSYFLDAKLIGYIKETYPSVRAAVATCWEEGPKAYRTCNNSWYTLFDGGPWNPWIPSKVNSHIPARDQADDSGIVAIPHLSRDLLACFDGNGSNFGTHPQNVLRGMIYKDGEYPYLFNLIDAYRSLEQYNDGYSYNMMFVGPAWMNKAGRWECDHALLVKSYEDCMAYYAQLKRDGELVDMTMEEFADWYRENRAFRGPECALWKDILYGSEKQLFWYIDSQMRTCLDMNQGGAMIDLRPYAARLDRDVGIGTEHIWDASYPYLIQAFYRAGYFTHYAGEGTIKSCKVAYGGQEVDLCLTRTQATFSKEGDVRVLTLAPVDIDFGSVTVTLVSRFRFVPDSGELEVTRRVTAVRGELAAPLLLKEYVTACYGTTEYPNPLTGMTLRVASQAESRTISYAYRCREETLADACLVEGVVPQIDTVLSVRPVGSEVRGTIREGYAFSPMFTLELSREVAVGEELVTCLKVQKAD